MKPNKLLTSLFLTFVLCFSFMNAIAGAKDPINLLQSVANNMISGLKQNQATLKTKPSVVYQLAYKFVVPNADLDEMSKRVLPPQVWNSATAAQKSEFKKEFTNTLIRTYASALTAYKNQSIKIYPVRGGYGKIVNVNSDIINPDSGAVHVTYQLIQSADGWRLLDMNVEGLVCL